MDDKKNILVKIKKLQYITSEELSKYELYAILTNIILSKEYFKKNEDIKEFLKQMDIVFKEYVFDSRTLIIARVLRIIEKAEIERIDKYKLILKEMYLNEKEYSNGMQKNKKKNSSNDYVSEILKKYSRNKEN